MHDASPEETDCRENNNRDDTEQSETWDSFDLKLGFEPNHRFNVGFGGRHQDYEENECREKDRPQENWNERKRRDDHHHAGDRVEHYSQRRFSALPICIGEFRDHTVVDFLWQHLSDPNIPNVTSINDLWRKGNGKCIPGIFRCREGLFGDRM